MNIASNHWTVQGIAKAIADDEVVDLEELAKAVNAAAYRAAEADVKAEFANAVAAGATEEQIRKHLLAVGLRSTDDTWSGRANDVRRAYADGRRETVQSLHDDLNYGGLEGFERAVAK